MSTISNPCDSWQWANWSLKVREHEQIKFLKPKTEEKNFLERQRILVKTIRFNINYWKKEAKSYRNSDGVFDQSFVFNIICIIEFFSFQKGEMEEDGTVLVEL